MTTARNITNPPIPGHKNLSKNGRWMKDPAKPHELKTLFVTSGTTVIPEMFAEGFRLLVLARKLQYSRQK